jgi:hypothetical protein
MAISAGGDQGLALKNDGTLASWGPSNYGVPAGLTGVMAISAGGDQGLALKNDGTVVAWGGNSYGESTIPPGLMGVTAIAAGLGQSLALKNDGTVVGWGLNSYGQATVPAGLTGITAIAAGTDSLALKNDRTVVAWGPNYYGGATIPSGLTGVTAIATGIDLSFALRAMTFAEQIENLRVMVDGLAIDAGVKGSLIAKLNAALASTAKQTPAACNQLAAFINEVAAQSGNLIPTGPANQLIQVAQQARITGGCG